MYDIITLLVEDHDNFIHILADRKHNEAFVVDPAWDAEGIREVLAEEGLTLTGILITHSHHDHVNAVSELYGERVSLFISEDEHPHWPGCPEDAILLTDGDEIAFANTSIGIIKTPGHTPVVAVTTSAAISSLATPSLSTAAAVPTSKVATRTPFSIVCKS